MSEKVLIGKVKNEHQFSVNIMERFYHIPEATLPQDMLPTDYVALYFTEVKDRKDKQVCIRYYGRVIKTELVLREEIASLPSANFGKRYYKFTVDNWTELPTPIVRDKGSVYTKAFVNLDELLSTQRLSVLLKIGDGKVKRKRETHFSDKQISNVELSEDLIAVKTLAGLINSAGEAKIESVKITKYLLDNGYLKLKELEGKIYRVATPKGNEIGVFSDRAERKGKLYYLTLYDKCAQQFVLDNINEIAKIKFTEAF